MSPKHYESSGGVSLAESEVLAISRELSGIRADLTEEVSRSAARLGGVHPSFQDSAENLLHYLALRRHDLRKLQSRLAEMGLSSLGRAESHVLATVDAVLDILTKLSGRPSEAVHQPSKVDFQTGERLLFEHTEALFGPAPADRRVLIMVTMPTEAASDPTLIHELLKQGMNCMRINCAHDEEETWSKMIENLRSAERALGMTCKVFMDLSGPKLRTGPIEPGAQVTRVRPSRDEFGRVIKPARVWLSADSKIASPPPDFDSILSVEPAWLSALKSGDSVRFTDARGSKRTLKIIKTGEAGCVAELHKTAYIVPGTTLTRGRSDSQAKGLETSVLAIPPKESALLLKIGDILHVTRNTNPGRAATLDSRGRVATYATIGCTLPEALESVHPGEAIWFDDGKIGGRVENVDSIKITVRITQARPDGSKLRSDKGINLPDTRLHLAAMTERDEKDLAFAARYADAVELSFANTARDVETLQHRLLSLGPRRPGIVLKVETKRGFEHLPAMMLAAMHWPTCGVMIARGDLAIECGFERLAEVQEEILWICEAAHVPVIWATQVLETLARTGIPSRAEISDAVMGHRAECVMLNKGPHVIDAVRVLNDILRRMQAHQAKKSSMLRGLHVACQGDHTHESHC